MLSPVQLYTDLVRKEQGDLPQATRTMRRTHPDLCATVLDTIGSWPSSEPELRELQRQQGA